MLRVSCIFVADGVKNGQKDEDLLEVEPLVCRGSFLPRKVAFWRVCRLLGLTLAPFRGRCGSIP